MPWKLWNSLPMQKCRGLFAPDIGSVRSSSYMMSSKVPRKASKKGRPGENFDWKTCMIPLFCSLILMLYQDNVCFNEDDLVCTEQAAALYLVFLNVFFSHHPGHCIWIFLKNLCRKCFVLFFAFSSYDAKWHRSL